ncbi:NADH dehydrogenase [ubiquinone] 1 beta subcomplex subunit 4 [Kryptolebias marmoratus]|uniref:NADH dehydrogenase [ubiquinone] 1 beta subcomplex subunit 4 n=1 Tax=Kryptolebias marmoratus TaxID=37003 RepID=A0A3Q3ATJ0_KRYMA|nr:NADH dehydrogenase [ubiquinone] 1 beta subcomplex subunit 4 [Kryptolebias marmoratus]
MAEYRETPLAERPKTLDPNEYFNVSLEKRGAEEARAAFRANLKRQYQMQLNNPHRKELIEDPALTNWVQARGNIYPHFRPTQRTSMFGLAFGVVPLFFFYYVFKTTRDWKEERIRSGTDTQKYRLTS